MEALNLGEEICRNLKSWYYPGEPWPKNVHEVGGLFSKIKNIAKKFYTDKNELEVLKILRSFSKADMDELLDIGNVTRGTLRSKGS